MVGGIAVAALGVPITGVLARTINMLAISSTAVSLFVIGGALVGLHMKGMVGDVSAIALGKLLLHPLSVGLLVWVNPPADPALRVAAVIFASVPMLSIYPILAQKYGFEGFSAAALSSPRRRRSRAFRCARMRTLWIPACARMAYRLRDAAHREPASSTPRPLSPYTSSCSDRSRLTRRE